MSRTKPTPAMIANEQAVEMDRWRSELDRRINLAFVVEDYAETARLRRLERWAYRRTGGRA